MNIDLRLKYELKIIKEHNNIYDELEIILNNKNGYTYKPIKEQIQHFLYTAKMRNNFTNYLNDKRILKECILDDKLLDNQIILPSKIKDNLIKTNNKKISRILFKW